MSQTIEKKFFEDMQIGDEEVSAGRTVTEADIVNFAGLSGDYNTIHTDAEFARGTIAGQRMAHGLLPLSIASGLYTRTAYNAAMMEQLVALTEIRWKFKKPVVIGDTIRVEIKVTDKSDRPGAPHGRVVMLRTIYNQRDEIVQQGEYYLLIKKRNP